MNDQPEQNSTDHLKHTIEVWKQTIEVQQHFNDIEMRIRNFGLTLMLAVLGAAGVALKEDVEMSLFGLALPFAAVLLFSGLVGWAAFWLMDRHWYHRLLYGAIRHGLAIEDAVKEQLPGIALTTRIKQESAFKRKGKGREDTMSGKDTRFGSRARLDTFYGMVAILLLILTLGMLAS